MYKKIMVPLDGSTLAEMVLPYAVETGAKLGAELILVSVSETTTADKKHLHRSYLDRVSAQVQRQLENQGAKEGCKVKTRVLTGTPANELLRFADESKVDLVVLASRGASGSSPWALGSTAAKVLRVTRRPVLLVRAPAPAAVLKRKGMVKRILTPLDGSKVGEAAVPHAQELAQTLEAEMVLFQVLEPVPAVSAGGAAFWAMSKQEQEERKASAGAYLDKMAKALQRKKVKVSTAVASGLAAEQIIDYAEVNVVDLIAMSTHGRSGIGRWVFGSVTDKVLHAGNTPVLVVPAARASKT